jgi:hypothetical protein
VIELGPSEQNIAKQALRQGQPLPDRIANAPELNLGLALYLNAFFELDTERTNGFGLGRIPLSTIRDYAIGYEFDEHQTEDLFMYVKRMDIAYLEYVGKKTQKD